ncbi:MAG: FAD-dependent oxidoreductase, partial [Pseudomonadota bacterium]
MTSAPLPDRCDLLVVGSGAGALSTAVTAAHLGLSVVVAEKEPLVGGTTAWSGGWMWIPRNPLAVAAGIADPLDDVRRYLRNVIGAHDDEARLEMFLAHAPAMVDFHLKHTALRFVDGNTVPDFHGRLAGARTGGRSVCAAPFDASVLGAELARLRPPRDILAFLGMSIGGDLRHFLRAGRAWDSFRYAAHRVLRHGAQCLRHGQGTTRMAGNALAAALFKSALDAGVRVFTGHRALALLTEGGRVVGARLGTPRGEREVRATRGVVLAAGGFPHDAQRQRQLFAHQPHGSAAPLSNTG